MKSSVVRRCTVTSGGVTITANECMTERPCSGSIKGICTTDKVYDVCKACCYDNNNGYAKTAKEYRHTLAGMLGSTFSNRIADGHQQHKIRFKRKKGAEFIKPQHPFLFLC